MRLQGKLVGSFALVALLLLIPSILALARLNALGELAVEGREQHAAAALALGRFETHLAELDRLQRSLLATRAPVFLPETQRALQGLQDAVPPLREEAYLGRPSSLTPIVAALEAVNLRIEELIQEERAEEADRVFDALGPLAHQARGQLEELATAIDRQAEADFVRAEGIIASSRAAVLVLLLVCGVLALILAVWAVRTIVTPTRRLAHAMADVTEGNFTAPEDLPYQQSDEIGELCGSFRTMTRRLAELDRMKAEFIAVAGHELKTPITVIAGYSELIEEELAEGLTEHQREILQGIAEQARVLTRLVNRLMDISRLESGGFRLEPESTYVEDLLTGLVRSFEVMAQRKNVQIRTSLDDSAPETIEVDADLIRNEVLGNLVSNAVKFVPEGGRIWIRVRGDADGAVFHISDNGPGIPPAHRPYVFEKHYQVERSRRVGSGLGLAIVREVVELHGGTVDLVDDELPGASFQVHLPVRRKGQEAPSGGDELELEVEASLPGP